jgi:hypothetical protein
MNYQIAIILLSLTEVVSFVPNAHQQQQHRHAKKNTNIFKPPISFQASPSNTNTNTNTDTSSSSSAQLPGVQEFEEWFAKSCGKDNVTTQYVKHGIFSKSGRGLQFIGNEKLVLSQDKAVVTLPKELVLQSTIVEDKQVLDTIADDWDSVLALQLLRECKKGKESDIYGYCMLLTRGVAIDASSDVPPSTAPHCIRNWTREQKDRLRESSKRGNRLVNIQEKQSVEWNQKYNALPAKDRDGFSDDQFYWAMEAVNSRAFKGDFGGDNLLKNLSKTLVPFAAAAFGLNFISSGSGPFASDERLTIALLVLSCAPVLLNFVSENFGVKTSDAVLLPFIDSANHLESARSNIEFDPVKGVFTVKVEGRNCIVKDENDVGENGSGSEKKQFYISYGEKKDTELLLNYGFLPNMKEILIHDDETGDSGTAIDDAIRRGLVETFNSVAL